jgi:hypothetical protein
MKRIIFLAAAFCLLETVAYSQKRLRTANEIKLNLATSLLLTPEINYERVKTADDVGFVKSDYFGYGLSAGVTLPGFTVPTDPEFDYHPEIYETNWQVVAYCRFYFNRRHNHLYHYGMKRPQLFFIEPGAAVIGFDDRSSFCLGLALGLKLINIMNCTGEIYAGGGSNLKRYDSVFFWRFGVNLGLRWDQK